MRLSRTGVVIALAIAAAALANAQEKKMETPKPGAEHKKLGYFIGKWHSETDVKPSAFGPGGKMTGDDDCTWAFGGFFAECRGAGNGPMGKMSSLGMLGYDPAGKVYTYNGFTSMGENEHATGTVEGKTWTYTNESTMNGKPMKGRYTIVEGGPDSYTFKFETSEDGKSWSTVMEGTATKKKS